jgi:hypothetical protein
MLMSGKILGQIKVVEIVDNPNGTCTIHFDVSEDMKKAIIESMGWKRWSNKKFNELVENSLVHYANAIAQQKAQTTEESK